MNRALTLHGILFRATDFPAKWRIHGHVWIAYMIIQRSAARVCSILCSALPDAAGFRLRMKHPQKFFPFICSNEDSYLNMPHCNHSKKTRGDFPHDQYSQG